MARLVNGIDVEMLEHEAIMMRAEIVGATIVGLFKAVAWPFRIVGEAMSMAKRYGELNEMSDAQLSEMGLSREHIPAAVVGLDIAKVDGASVHVLEPGRRVVDRTIEKIAA